MRFGRILRTTVMLIAAALVFSACTGHAPAPLPATSQATPTQGGSVTVAEPGVFSSFNPTSATGASALNDRIAYATHAGFNYVDNNLALVRNEAFGTYKMVSENPLVIKYTVNDGVQWSDGAPVDANDLLLAWAAASGYYDDATVDKDFKVTAGTRYFTPSTTAAALGKTALPEIGDDGRSLTLTYTHPNADWETAFGSRIDVPAHIVAVRSGLKDAGALSALLLKIPAGNPAKPVPANAELRRVADFWNTGFDTKAMPDPSLALSNGPYVIKTITAGKSLELTRNPDYKWGPAAHLDTIAVTSIANAGGRISALADGTADLIDVPANTDDLALLAGMKGAGVKFQVGRGPGFEQVALNFKGVFANPALRQAFLKTVPRQDIVNELVKPLDPGAATLNSLLLVPSQSAYNEAAGNNGSAKYAAPDLEGARSLLAGATPTVRLLYNKDDDERAAAFALIAASARQAGFKIVDEGVGATTWRAKLQAGTYDAALFGLTSAGAGTATIEPVFKTGGAANTNNYSNALADQLMDELLVTPDRAKRDALKVQIDKLLWDSFYGLPLYQDLTLTATGAKVSGLVPSPVSVGPWWNVWDWKSGK
ncbi:ABC transporter family substrate-binding protein [Specibacter cremeus]|uniref:ABC transporter family substrate-binding protein n=1 Tax=Specibacter cremeus TaxID=1629051 RepID=UPI000F79771D|nr:ABC transporter family substrate-binding protein [Specibacter cremeus]